MSGEGGGDQREEGVGEIYRHGRRGWQKEEETKTFGDESLWHCFSFPWAQSILVKRKMMMRK